MTLRGVSVLITRRREQSSDLVQAIEERGGCPVVIPMIRIVAPAAWEECDRAIDRLQTYDSAVFTSPNSVLWFFRRLEERGVEGAILTGRAVYAVGPSTAAALEHRGVPCRDLPGEASGQALAEKLQGDDVAGKKFLVPRGDRARDEVARGLEASGASVDSPVVYRTLPPAPEDAEELVRLTGGRAYRVVIFASPSAVQNFAASVPAEVLRRIVPQPRIVAVGRTTADAIRQLGFPVDSVAADPGSAALVRAIEQVVEGT